MARARGFCPACQGQGSAMHGVSLPPCLLVIPNNVRLWLWLHVAFLHGRTSLLEQYAPCSLATLEAFVATSSFSSSGDAAAEPLCLSVSAGQQSAKTVCYGGWTKSCMTPNTTIMSLSAVELPALR